LQHFDSGFGIQLPLGCPNVRVDGDPGAQVKAEFELRCFFGQERRDMGHRKTGHYPPLNQLLKMKLAGGTPYDDLLCPVRFKFRHSRPRKLGGTFDVATPVMHDAAAELRAGDRQEVHSEKLKQVDNLESQMSGAKKVASQV
jgi:hypothetical protein